MRACIVGLALLCVPAASSVAQVVRGSVTEQASQRVLPGVVVVLLDASGKRAAGVLTDEQGRFAVLAPAAGRYTLRTERIGFRATTSDPVSLGAGETREVALVTSVVPVRLTAVKIVRSSGCDVRDQAGRDVSDVWEEVRKALYATALSQDTPNQLRMRRFTRSVHARDGRVLNAQSDDRSGSARRPFTSIPASRLSRDGYIVKTDTGVVYFAPDADVLLSDEFVADHCLRLRAADAAHGGQVGLAFEPTRARSVPDVRGALWVDAQTSELRTLEFEFTHIPGLPRGTDASVFGGTIAFHRLSTGVWIVKQWVIRMPELEVLRADDPRRTFGLALGSAEAFGLKAIREAGGEVLEIVGMDGRTLIAGKAATLLGQVIDSSRAARPLAGARVVLDGTSFTTTTDTAGRFRLSDVPDGVYGASFLHPRLDSLGTVAAVIPVTLRGGADATLTLAIPPMSVLLGRICPKAEQPHGTAALRGTVRYVGIPGKVRGARVTVSWPALVDDRTDRMIVSERTITTQADDDGKFVTCGLPEGTRVTIRARIDEQLSERESMLLAADVINTRDIQVRVSSTVAVAPTPTGPPAATRLPSVQVQAGPEAPVDKDMVGFETRRRRGLGFYLARDEIDRRKASRLSDLLRTVPWIEVRTDTNGETVIQMRRARGGGSPTANPPPMPRGDSTRTDPDRMPDRAMPTNENSCPIAMYVEGVAHETMGTSIDGEIRPDDVEALEAYRGGQVPSQFSSARADCGVIVIWLRSSARRSGLD